VPARQVMKKFHAGKLHSGSKTGPKVTNPKQAKAIEISEARAEGHDISSKRARNKRLEKEKL
jgi:Family of unknown function (DUF6496)